jgi:hypothetical protein
VQLDHVPAPRHAGRAIAGPQGKAIQPGVPRVGVPKRADVPPGEDQRVLDRILGAVTVAEDQVGDAMQPGIRGSHQDRERLVVAGLGSLDERSLHVATGFGATHLVALYTLRGSGWPERFH